MIAGGSMFQTLAVAMGKARSPMVSCSDRGTCNNAVDEGRRRPRATQCAMCAYAHIHTGLWWRQDGWRLPDIEKSKNQKETPKISWLSSSFLTLIDETCHKYSSCEWALLKRFLQRVCIARIVIARRAVRARGIMSICLSVGATVCPSVTFRCFVQMNEDTIMQFSASVGQSF